MASPTRRTLPRWPRRRCCPCLYRPLDPASSADLHHLEFNICGYQGSKWQSIRCHGHRWTPRSPVMEPTTVAAGGLPAPPVLSMEGIHGCRGYASNVVPVWFSDRKQGCRGHRSQAGRNNAGKPLAVLEWLSSRLLASCTPRAVGSRKPELWAGVAISLSRHGWQAKLCCG